jgi:hypothetical protein
LIRPFSAVPQNPSFVVYLPLIRAMVARVTAKKVPFPAMRDIKTKVITVT